MILLLFLKSNLTEVWKSSKSIFLESFSHSYSFGNTLYYQSFLFLYTYMDVNSIESINLNQSEFVQMKPMYKIYISAYTYEYIIAFIYFAQTRLGTTQLKKCWLAVAWLYLKNKTNLYKFAKYQTYVSLLY